WLSAGTIVATHDEYRAPKITDLNQLNDQIGQKVQRYLSNPDKRELTEDLRKMKLDAMPFNVRYELSNECTMRSNVVVRFDGDRFYWEINVESRTDSVKRGKALRTNFMTDEFNLTWNGRRIFAWDGEKYTIYAPGANHSTVDAADNLPRGVNGPLTAGIVPWGYGLYTYDNLAATESSAVEKIVDGRTQIHLTINNSDGSESLFVLDVEKDYAVLSCSMTGSDNSITSRQYSNYQLVADKWLPATILIERREAGSDRLLARDLWDITSINGDVPAPDSFVVGCADDTLIEYYSYMADEEPQVYRHSDMVDTDLLLSERLTFLAAEGLQPQNCATAASRYVAAKLGRAFTDEQLAQLVNEPNEDTSLYQIKQFMQSLGLYCRAVRADIRTLRRLNGCEVILHIPSKEHFVAFERIDNQDVWIVDLADNKFYYRTDINFFDMDWTAGTALLISDQPIDGQFTDIGDDELTQITGAQEYYKCNKVLQNYGQLMCDYVSGLCGGYFYVFEKRRGCGISQSGSCSTDIWPRYHKWLCINDPPGGCKTTGDPITYYMRACN
ncbi:MAG: cysteine peptidase family C39 domain-containing protein, partial [Planctomycetota bacterium]